MAYSASSSSRHGPRSRTAWPTATPARDPADDRPAETIADQITQTTRWHDEGDSSAPPDPGETLHRFVQAITATAARERDGSWPGGTRHHIPDPGPVPSSRFR